MYILGINENHNATAALLKDGELIGAIGEERLNRTKSWRGFPAGAIEYVCRMGGITPRDVDAVAFSGYNTPMFFTRIPAVVRMADSTKKVWDVEGPVRRAYFNFEDLMGRIPGANSLAKLLSYPIERSNMKGIFRPDAKIRFVDHHRAHGYAHYYSGFSESVVVTIDGQGDGVSTAIWHARDGELRQVHTDPTRHSLGELYSLFTAHLGFNPYTTGQGKVMTLAAVGSPVLLDALNRYVRFDPKQGRITTDIGLGIGQKRLSAFLKEVCECSREDLAASIQAVLERVVADCVSHYAKKLGCGNVVLAGGVALNVKMNKCIREADGVEDIFIYPAADDGGLAVLAALETYKECFGGTVQSKQIDQVYYAAPPEQDEVDAALKKYEGRVVAERKDDIDMDVVRLLADKKVVWRYQGAMEFGPRALGHRSILASPADVTVNRYINECLRRELYMPMCPSFLAEKAHEYFKDFTESPFMIMAFEILPGQAEKIPAVVHVDNTVRPQTVKKDIEPRYWRILNEVDKLTGIPCLLNTSFNNHEEPIVSSPEDAVASFLSAGGGYLALEDYLVRPVEKTDTAD